LQHALNFKVLCVTVESQWLYSACDKSSETEQKRNSDIKKACCNIQELAEKYCGPIHENKMRFVETKKLSRQKIGWFFISGRSLSRTVQLVQGDFELLRGFSGL
jgi:hypothetical protein